MPPVPKSQQAKQLGLKGIGKGLYRGKNKKVVSWNPESLSFEAPRSMRGQAVAGGLKGIGRGQYKNKAGKVVQWNGSKFAAAKYTPETPPVVPAGMYDPSLDAQGRAATRGLGDLTADTAKANTRASDDYLLNKADITRTRDEGLADLTKTMTRGTRDVGTARTRGQQDYTTGVADLARSYSRLGNQQAQAQRTAGVDESGLVKLAGARRAENMALDRQPMDLNFQRSNEDLTQRLGDLTTDVNTSKTRTTQGADRSQGQLSLGFQRGNEDRNLTLTRATRENRFYQSDLGAEKTYQAKSFDPNFVLPKPTPGHLIRPPLRPKPKPRSPFNPVIPGRPPKPKPPPRNRR